MPCGPLNPRYFGAERAASVLTSPHTGQAMRPQGGAGRAFPLASKQGTEQVRRMSTWTGTQKASRSKSKQASQKKKSVRGLIKNKQNPRTSAGGLRKGRGAAVDFSPAMQSDTSSTKSQSTEGRHSSHPQSSAARSSVLPQVQLRQEPEAASLTTNPRLLG